MGKNTYVVQTGDSWTKIAQKLYNNQLAFEELIDANRASSGRKIALHAGMTLNIPDPKSIDTSFVSARTFAEATGQHLGDVVIGSAEEGRTFAEAYPWLPLPDRESTVDTVDPDQPILPDPGISPSPSIYDHEQFPPLHSSQYATTWRPRPSYSSVDQGPQVPPVNGVAGPRHMLTPAEMMAADKIQGIEDYEEALKGKTESDSSQVWKRRGPTSGAPDEEPIQEIYPGSEKPTGMYPSREDLLEGVRKYMGWEAQVGENISEGARKYMGWEAQVGENISEAVKKIAEDFEKGTITKAEAEEAIAEAYAQTPSTETQEQATREYMEKWGGMVGRPEKPEVLGYSPDGTPYFVNPQDPYGIVAAPFPVGSRRGAPDSTGYTDDRYVRMGNHTIRIPGNEDQIMQNIGKKGGTYNQFVPFAGRSKQLSSKRTIPPGRTFGLGIKRGQEIMPYEYGGTSSTGYTDDRQLRIDNQTFEIPSGEDYEDALNTIIDSTAGTAGTGYTDDRYVRMRNQTFKIPGGEDYEDALRAIIDSTANTAGTGGGRPSAPRLYSPGPRGGGGRGGRRGAPGGASFPVGRRTVLPSRGRAAQAARQNIFGRRNGFGSSGRAAIPSFAPGSARANNQFRPPHFRPYGYSEFGIISWRI